MPCLLEHAGVEDGLLALPGSDQVYQDQGGTGLLFTRAAPPEPQSP